MRGERRRARFRCVMVFLHHARDASPIIGEGSWDGYILEEASGDNGFGYDPLFYVPERDCSAACLSAREKNSLSHRGKAMRALLEKLDPVISPLGLPYNANGQSDCQVITQ